MNTQQQNPFSFDGGGGGNDDGEGSSSSNNNALILSLYLIDSQDDLLDSTTTTNANDGDAGVKQQRAARLYQRLCEACDIANNILVQSSYSLDGGGDDVSPPAAKKYHPWSSGGDGPIFGIHCDTSSDDEKYATMNDMDGDDIWQQSQQIPKNNNQSMEVNELNHDAIRQQQEAEVAANNKRRVVLDDNQQQQQQPHLRAICQYNNDINDLWRCISLAYQISTQLSSTKSSFSSSSSDDEDDSSSYLTCAMEVWDSNDGHILLIEGAEYLPNWVDDDITQGGVGGPRGCRNRCWIVNGKVCLIPPSLSVNRTSSSIDDDDDDDDGKDDDVATLSRQDALRILMESNEDGEELIIDSRIIASNSVQCAIQDRINRIDYSTARSRSRSQSDQNGNKRIDKEPNNSNTQPPRHWHIAAVALPASVARFVQLQPSLVPLLVDSFCDGAPTYLKEQQSGDYVQTNDDTNASKSTTTTTTISSSFGKSFPYEQIVIVPVTFTRTNYAELVTGRGIVPSFPIPKSYKSVELNRFQRQLRQSTDHYMADNEDDEEIGGGGTNAKMKKRRNPYTRAVDVGVRLCAGLDWIIANNNNDKKRGCGGSVQDTALESLENSAISTLGEVERRLRIYWTRIDAEASGIRSEENVDSSLVSPWIEQAWQAGPNGSGIQSGVSDKVLLQALESMSKCHVFNPELSQPLWKQPCPCTRSNILLHTMVQSGINSALKWQREKYTDDSFPMPRVWDVDDDNWMEVNSLEELEEEMRSLSSRPNKARSSSSTDANVKDDESKPRRTTRRRRRKLAQTNLKEDEKTDGFDSKPQDEDAQPVKKVLNGVQSFVDDEGDLEGAVTKAKSSSSTEDKNCINQDSAEQLMSQEVNINPRKFLDILHARLSNQNTAEVSSNAIDQEDNISKFFFEEDLDDADMSDSSEQSNDDDLINDKDYNPQSQDEDPFSLHNIMEAMDHELRTDAVSHPSIRNLSVASEENNGGNGGSGTGDDETDLAILSNLLSSIDAHGEASGPVSNILREMGIGGASG